jgi:hypothetical protein
MQIQFLFIAKLGTGTNFHTIQWNVTDDAGNTDGICSRVPWLSIPIASSLLKADKPAG